MLSNRGRQTLTYHCLNSVGFEDGSGEDRYEKALVLKTFADDELTADAELPKYRYRMIEDTCQVRTLLPENLNKISITILKIPLPVNLT